MVSCNMHSINSITQVQGMNHAHIQIIAQKQKSAILYCNEIL